ncbi:uncharacterized protein LOC133202419 [Saccostrea echinata]|uniref:uncharacterized protein LOC133202419 n=1 Tax=Saccostrea echinata TaxID=191078 RepID=UPI002A80EC43|nr:uncharacterized protein LOC133202419 [Saccostrea echinata]
MLLRRCRRNIFRYSVPIAFLFLYAFFQFKFSNSELRHSASEVSARDGRRLFGDLHNDTLVDVWNLSAKDERLVSKIKQLIEKPEKGDYNLTHPDVTDFSRGQSIRINQLLDGKKRGFYIEIGASDGEDGSVSLFFERSREWDGLLIEPHPGRYRQLRQKHRKALTLRACVRSNSSKHEKEFEDTIEGHVKIPCLWLESILNALDKNTVDLLSVDARDQEMELLKAIPLSKYAVNVITVEFVEGSGSDLSVMRYLLDHGYHANHQFVNHPLHRNDMVFTRKKSS